MFSGFYRINARPPLVGRDRLTAFYDSDTRKSNARTVLTDSCNMCRVYCSCPSSSFIICCSDCSASRISECCWLSCVIVTSRSTLARCCFVVRGALSPRLLMCRNGAQSSQSRIEVRPWLRRTLYEKKTTEKILSMIISPPSSFLFLFFCVLFASIYFMLIGLLLEEAYCLLWCPVDTLYFS